MTNEAKIEGQIISLTERIESMRTRADNLLNQYDETRAKRIIELERSIRRELKEQAKEFKWISQITPDIDNLTLTQFFNKYSGRGNPVIKRLNDEFKKKKSNIQKDHDKDIENMRHATTPHIERFEREIKRLEDNL